MKSSIDAYLSRAKYNLLAISSIMHNRGLQVIETLMPPNSPRNGSTLFGEIFVPMAENKVLVLLVD